LEHKDQHLLRTAIAFNSDTNIQPGLKTTKLEGKKKKKLAKGIKKTKKGKWMKQNPRKNREGMVQEHRLMGLSQIKKVN
jgi:hypothetical protein